MLQIGRGVCRASSGTTILKDAPLAEEATVSRKAGIILAIIAALEGCWLLVNANHRLGRFLHYTGFKDANAGTWGWVSATVITVLFLAYSARLSSVRSNFIRFSWLKILAIAVAITAGFCEETIFRKVLLDTLQIRGFGLIIQLAASALAFGADGGLVFIDGHQ
jgi:membrane protease YdiL (CAAX protease family)